MDSNIFKVVLGIPELLAVIEKFGYDESHYVAYMHTKDKITNKAASKLMPLPTVAPALLVPPEFSQSTVAYVTMAYKARQTMKVSLTHNNYIDMMVGASNISSGVEVSFKANEAELTVKKEEFPAFGKQAELGKYVEEKKKVSYQSVSGKVTDVDLPMPVLEIAYKCVLVHDFNVGINKVVDDVFTKIPVCKVREWVLSLSSIREGVIVVDKTMQNQAYSLAMNPNFKPMVRSIMTKTDKPIKQMKFLGKTLADTEMIYERLSLNSELKKTMKFMDVPRQWMNCPLKWGAVMGYMYDGDYSRPRQAVEGSYYYGAKGWKASRIFQKSVLCDIDMTHAPKMSNKISEEVQDILKGYYPKILMRNVFQHQDDKNPVYSDAWSKSFSDESVGNLLKLVSEHNVIKFNCKISLLAKVLAANHELFPLTLLNFGRPTSIEVFLTKRESKYEDEWVIKLTRDNFMQRFQDLLAVKNQIITDFKVSLINSPQTVIARKRRPFVIENWMWPNMAGPGSLKNALGMNKIVPLAHLAQIVEGGGLEQMDTADFIESQIGETQKSYQVPSSPSPSSSNNNSNNNASTNTTSGGGGDDPDVYDTSLFN